MQTKYTTLTKAELTNIILELEEKTYHLSNQNHILICEIQQLNEYIAELEDENENLYDENCTLQAELEEYKDFYYEDYTDSIL